MLVSMADGMLDFIESKISLIKRKIDWIMKPSPVLPFPKVLDEDNSNIEISQEEISNTDGWILVYFEKQKINSFSSNIAKKGVNLEVTGNKANIREEK